MSIPTLTGSVRVTLPLLTISEANARGHWRSKARRTKDARAHVYLALPMHLRACKVAAPWTVTLVRIAPSGGLDDDNLRSALKGVRDQIAAELKLPDDRDPRATWRYEQRRGNRRDPLLNRGYGVEIRIDPRALREVA